MTELTDEEFQVLARRVRALKGDYGAGYGRGLRRRHYGESFGGRGEHERWLGLGTGGDTRTELGRGYRDGFEGVEPTPQVGRPPLPAGQARTARVEWRTTDELKAKALELSIQSNISLSEWLNRLVESA